MKTLIALPLLLAAAPVFAGGTVPMSQPMAAPMMTSAPLSWSGAYVGAQIGGAFDPDTGVLTLEADPSTPPFGAFGDNFYGAFDSEFVGGLHAGYDAQFGRFVVGGILDVTAANLEETQGGDSSTPAFYREVRTLDYYATLRGRAGVTVFDRGLLYAHGGLAYGEVDYRFDSNTPANVATSGDSDAFGYVVGAGMEALLTDNISFGVEYQYVNLGDSDFDTTLSGGPFGTGVSATGSEDDFDFHVVNAKMSYRF